MTEHLTDVDQLPISEVIGELKHDLRNADAGPWEIYTSNSYRRVGLAGTYKPVVYPVVAADGQPDIAGFNNLRAMVESFNAAPRLIAEIERLRTALTGISTCSTCEACRGAALRALGGVTPEPPCGPGDTGYTEMLERIRDEVGVEIFDMQHPHTWFRAARAAQPPGGVRATETTGDGAK